MTTFAVWCVAGFLWVFFFPARNVPSHWAQLLLGGPVIWITMGVLYWKGAESSRDYGCRRPETLPNRAGSGPKLEHPRDQRQKRVRQRNLNEG